MTQKLRAIVVAAVGCMTMVGVAAQQAPTKAPPVKPTAAKPAAAPAYKAIATLQDLMSGMVDPASKVVFGAVSSEDTPNGTVEKAPKNDAEWFFVRRSALTLAEAANLLLVPGRHFAVPANAQKHGDGELSPAASEALVSKDRAAWNTLVLALREAAMGAVTAAEAKRKDDFGAVSEAIDTACENCHLRFWYPEQVDLFKDAPKQK